MSSIKKNILYIVCAYAFIWLLCIPVLSGVLQAEETLVTILSVIVSWSPTITLLILFSKLFPGRTVNDFFTNVFGERVNIKMIFVLAIVQILVVAGATGVIALSKETPLADMFDLSIQALVAGFAVSLITGATGEESGWRGFLQQSVEKSFGVVKSSLIVGLIWVLWHVPAWLIDSFEAGIMLRYIIAFTISIISLSVIIGVCYCRCRNLFIPIWIHFMFNLTTSVLIGDEGDLVNVLIWISAFYIIAAIGYVVWYKTIQRDSVRKA